MKRTRFFLISGHKMYKIFDLANNEPIWHQKDARGGFRGMRKVLPGKSLMLSQGHNRNPTFSFEDVQF